MSGSILEPNPFGQGNTLRSRAGRTPFDASKISIAYTEWKPHDYQAPLLAVDRGIILANGALGAGKSEPGAEQLIRWAFRYPRRKDGRPTKWYVIGPDFSLIKQEQFSKLLEHIRKITVPGFTSLVKRVVYGQDPRIILCHDQVIIGRSAKEPNRLRGHEIDGFWGDEVQNWPERAFRIALSRLRSAQATRVILTGSPEDSPAWVWRMLSGEDEKYNALRAKLITEGEGSGFYAARWHSKQNKTNEEGVLDTIRAGLDASAEGVSAQELEGRFPGTPEAPSLGLISYSTAFVGPVALSSDQARPEVLGVDVGETDDFTWLTVLSARGVVLHMERWNAGSPEFPGPRTVFFPWAEGRIEHVARTWGVRTIVVDVAKYGKPIWQSLDLKLKPSVTSIGYDTGVRRRKGDLIGALSVALSRGDVRIPTKWRSGEKERAVDHVPQLRKEFEEIVPFDIGQGHQSYNHPAGGHDDGIVSLALAFHGLPGMGRQAAHDLKQFVDASKKIDRARDERPGNFGGQGRTFGGGGFSGAGGGGRVF